MGTVSIMTLKMQIFDFKDVKFLEHWRIEVVS